MKTLKQLDNRGVHLAVKNGKGIIALCAEYNCKEEELKETIGKIFSLNTKEGRKILSDLEKIDRRKKDLKKAYSAGIYPVTPTNNILQ